MSRLSPRGGFSIAEVLVAFVLLGVGVLSLASAAAMATATLREAALRQSAVLEAALVLDSLAGAPRAAADSALRGPFRLLWSGADSAGSVDLRLDVYWSSGAATRQLSLGRRAAPPPPRIHHAW